MVAGCIEDEEVVCRRMRFKGGAPSVEPLLEGLGSGGEAGSVVVAVAQIGCEHAAAVGSLPPHFAGLVGQPAPEGGRLDSESVQDLGKLPDVSQGIWHIPDGHAASEPPRDMAAPQQVADERLRAHQELIREHVPGADEKSPLSHPAHQFRFAVRADLEVVLQENRLPVEGEMREAWIALEDVEEEIDQVDELQAERLE